MKIKTALILVISVLFSNCQEETKTPKNQLEKVISDFNEKSSISYDLDYRIKYFDYPDTTSISAKTIIIKEKSDSLFGGYIWFSRKDSTNDYIKYYDLNSFYIVNNHRKEVIRYNPDKPIPYGFTNNFDGKLLNTYFLQDSALKKFIQDSIYEPKVTDENRLLKLSIVYPDGDEVINQEKEILFDKSLNAVKQIIFRAELDNLQEYNEWNLSNINFDIFNAEDLEKKFRTITKNYEFKEYEPPSKEETLPLEKGEKAVNFEGEYLKSKNNKFQLDDFSDKIIILDFWYKNCPPCNRAIPQLNNIYAKYKSHDVEFFGLNDIDTDSLSRERLIPFLQSKGIEYPVVLIDRTVSEKYQVIGYPTFYIINKSGKIEYSKLGYSDDLEKEVDSVLNKLLQ